MIMTELPSREKFATQVDATLLSDLRDLAKIEGRQIQVLIDEAIANLLEQRRQGKARTHVMKAYQSSHARFASVYDKLAK
jgi:hypothetical protein